MQRASAYLALAMGASVLMLSACSQAEVPAPQANNALIAAPVKTYAVLDFNKDFAKHVGVTEGMDKAEALDLIRIYFADAGRQPVVFENDDLAAGGSRMIVTRAGLKDDSVSAEQFIAMFQTAPSGQQSVSNYGLRVKCARGANPDKWQNTPCP